MLMPTSPMTIPASRFPMPMPTSRFHEQPGAAPNETLSGIDLSYNSIGATGLATLQSVKARRLNYRMNCDLDLVQ